MSDIIRRLSDRPLAFPPAGNRSAVGARRRVLPRHLVHEFGVAGPWRPAGPAAPADCPARRSLAGAVAVFERRERRAVAIDGSSSRHRRSGGTMTEQDAIQRRWARVVGFSYVFALAPAVFAEFYVSGRLVSDNAIVTAQNIIAHERLFRLGIASNLLVSATDVLLVTALYVVLERVNRRLALLATFFRLAETTILIVAVLNDFYVLRLLSEASYLTTVNSGELAALARVSIGAHGSAYNVGLVLFGFGSSVFCYLWLRSGYIPKPLAVWGLLASVWIGICAFTFVVFPEFTKVISDGYYARPAFMFGVTHQVRVVFNGCRQP